MGYPVLTVAMAAEVGATVALRMSNGLRRPLLAAPARYGVALWLLAPAVRTVPLSVSYPMWAGVGTAGALLAAWAVSGERLIAAQWAGVALVLLGVVLLDAPQVAGAGA